MILVLDHLWLGLYRKIVDFYILILNKKRINDSMNSNLLNNNKNFLSENE